LSTIGSSTYVVTLSTKNPDVTLTGAIDAYGTVATLSGVTFEAAVYAPAGKTFTLTNDGDVVSAGTSATDNGILFLGTGTITNAGAIEAGAGISILGTKAGALVQNSGAITATYGNGIYLRGKGDVINTGTITAQAAAGISLASDNRIANYGFIDANTGVTMQNGGYLYNGGSIRSSDNGIVAVATSSAGNVAIYNFGDITAATFGVQIIAPGYFYNAGTVAAQYGVELVGGTRAAAGIVTNAGLIKGVGTHSVGLATESAYDHNSGIIKSGFVGAEVLNGVLYNTGTINAPYLGLFGGSAGVYNYGTIIQSGTISANMGLLQSAVEVVGTSSLYNSPTGLIRGSNIGLASSGTAANYGLISGGSLGVLSAGSLYNAGTILGGVAFYQSTFTNAGLVEGNASFAISITSDQKPAQLVIDPGSTIDGAVTLSGGALDIAAGAQTITIAASQFSGIGGVTIAGGSNAEFAGSLSVGGSAGVANAGLITEAKDTGLTIGGPLTGAGSIDIGARSALILAGTAASAQSIAFSGTGGTLAIAAPAGFAASIDKFAAGDTINLTGVSLASIESLDFNAGSLTISAAGTYIFTFANPGGFKTETFAAFADGTGTGITLASKAAMNFLTPSAAPSATTLPDLAAVYTRKSAPEAPLPPAATVTHGGWLGQMAVPAANAVPAVTLQA
jgi:hypothetical protein